MKSDIFASRDRWPLPGTCTRSANDRDGRVRRSLKGLHRYPVPHVARCRGSGERRGVSIGSGRHPRRLAPDFRERRWRCRTDRRGDRRTEHCKRPTL